MKALFISNDPNVFNTESAVRRRMREYAASIGTLHVIAPGTSAQVDEYGKGVQEGPLSLRAVTGGRIQRLATLKAAAHRTVREEGIEIVSAQDPFEYGLVALNAVAGADVGLHVQVHTDFLSPWFARADLFRASIVRVPVINAVRLRIADAVLPRARGIRVVSERVKSSLVERFGNRIPEPSVIPITIDGHVPAKRDLPPHPFGFSLITVGRLEPEKRIEDILYAVARIRTRYPALGLFIAGEGRSRGSLERLTQKLGLADQVIFLGNRTDVRGLMQDAQAYIQASAYEGYGRTLVEAALACIPIITTDVGIIGEVFEKKEDVLAAPPGDPAALARHIATLVEDRSVRTRLVMGAEQKARRHLASHPSLAVEVTRDLARALQRV